MPIPPGWDACPSEVTPVLFKLPLANSFPYPFVKNTPVLRAWYASQARGGGGGLWISSDGDDQMIFLG